MGQVSGRFQIVADEADIAIDSAFQNGPTISCAQPAADCQFCSASYRSNGARSFTSCRVLLDSCFQNQQVGNISGIPVTLANHLLELFRFAQLI
jgi:hypothetical protein